MKLEIVLLLVCSMINLSDAKKTFKKKYKNKKKHRSEAIIPVKGTAVPQNEV